jgi:hypothetical protein
MFAMVHQCIISIFVRASRAAGALKRRAVPKAPRTARRVRKPFDKSWKKMIVGRAQKTGTPSHAFRVYREAIRMAKSGEYDKIWLNRSYRTTTGTKTIPRRLPDILGQRTTGQFDSVEVLSRTDVDDFLIRRNREAMSQLPEAHQGDFYLIRITESEK